MLYRGARFEPAWDDRDLVEATIQLASFDRRFVFTYIWQVDFAGHVHGLDSQEFDDAMAYASGIWEELSDRLPPGVVLLGTADHGLVEYGEDDKLLIREDRFRPLRFAGDPRGIQVWGNIDLIAEFAAACGTEAEHPNDLYGDALLGDAGDRIVRAPPGKVLLPPGFDKRLRCYHGGLDAAETDVPLLIR
jgi:hypothetical protein